MPSQILQELERKPWQDVEIYAKNNNIPIPSISDPMKRKAAIINAAKNGVVVEKVAPKIEEKAANPEEVSIEDLPKMPANSEVNFSPLNLENLCGCVLHDKDGNLDLINIPKAVSIINAVFHPKSFSDNEILVYEHGVYNRGGKEIIVKALNDAFAHFTDGKGNIIYNKYTKSEILRCIVDGSHVKTEDFDNNLDIINMKNGLYNWKTGEFKNHTPDYLSIIQIPVVYDKFAECPNIDKMLMVAAKPDDIIKLYEFVAYLLYRKYPIQKFLILFGPPNTGKSVFLNIMVCFIGEKNKTSASLKDIQNDKSTLVGFYGKLANFGSELSKEMITNTGIIKNLTSNTDPIRARDLYKSSIDYINFAKFVFCTNILPPINEDIAGFAKRVEIAQFTHVYIDDDYDEEFLASLTSPKELSGLFNKAVKLLPDLIKRNKFNNQLTTAKATELYLERSKPEESFFDNFVEEDAHYFVSKKTLFKCYSEYCKRLKISAMSPNKFGTYIIKNCSWISDKRETKRIGEPPIPTAIWSHTKFNSDAFKEWTDNNK